MKGFERNDVSIHGDSLEQVFHEFSSEGQNNQINYLEWLAATIGPKCLNSANSVKLAFTKFDISGNGFLSFEDLSTVIGNTEAFKVTEGRAKIDFAEFQHLVDCVGKKRSSIRGSLGQPSRKCSTPTSDGMSPISEDSGPKGFALRSDGHYHTSAKLQPASARFMNRQFTSW